MILQMTSLYFDGRGHVCYFEIAITRMFLCIVTLRLTSVEEIQDHGSSWCGGTGHSQLYFILPVSSVFITIYVKSDEDFRLRKYYFGLTGTCWFFFVNRVNSVKFLLIFTNLTKVTLNTCFCHSIPPVNVQVHTFDFYALFVFLFHAIVLY